MFHLPGASSTNRFVYLFLFKKKERNKKQASFFPSRMTRIIAQSFKLENIGY